MDYIRQVGNYIADFFEQYRQNKYYICQILNLNSLKKVLIIIHINKDCRQSRKSTLSTRIFRHFFKNKDYPDCLENACQPRRVGERRRE